VALEDFSLKGNSRSDLRNAENRMKKLGAVFEVIPAAQASAIMDELKQVSDEWLEDKSAHEKGFSLGAFKADYLAHFDIAVVKIDGKIIAFVNLIQGANKAELSLDLMRFAKSAPKGVMDFLFAEIMLWGKAQGFQFFSLGMAPLSGLEHHALAPVWHKIGSFIFKHGDSFYNFEGLRAYKEKYNPIWRPRYIATTSGLAMPAALLDTSRLISGGVMKLLLKKKPAYVTRHR
jgi:phosphatidylglycerol lysyltransferase